MKDVTLNQREQTRLHVLNTVLEHQLPVCQAAEILGVSERHVWRLLAAYRKEGAAALAHGNRGRRPRNAVSDAEAAAVVQLASTTYAGANQTHLAELLRDREGIDLSRRTVHRILTRAGIPSPRKRRPPRHRVRRQRMPQEGMLVQVDGSYHPWLGKGGPYFTLLLAVDDATGIVVNAVFRPEEDTRGYFTLMEGLIQCWEIPLALYCDRHGVFKFSGNPRHIQPPVEATHFSRAMVELGLRGLSGFSRLLRSAVWPQGDAGPQPSLPPGPAGPVRGAAQRRESVGDGPGLSQGDAAVSRRISLE